MTKLSMKVHIGEICKSLKMQRDCALRIADRGRLTSFSGEYKTGNQSLFECSELITKKIVEVDMLLRRFRRQYEQLSQFERERITGMVEAGWSARPGSGRPRQTSRRENRNIVRNAGVQPNASSAAIQAQVAPSLGALTIRRRLD
ncbi:transposable element Tcb2 transposase [Trichonephila clavipes]|nr:transposable element Tcb2 transposase [Trichonephila clavipes]